MLTILLVEDDVALSIGIKYALEKENFRVITAKNLRDGEKMYKSEKPDLILLDLILPDGKGYGLCKKIRSENELPIIFITACDEEANVVMGLDIGGDDYITKPVRINELISRIKAVLRRSKKLNNKSKERLMSGELIIEPLKFKIYKGDRELRLTSTEYKLLLLFIENKGNVMSRNLLMEKLWDMDGNFIGENTLNVYIRRLREKIEDDLKKQRYIETVRGIGYRWNEEVRTLD